MKRENKSFIVFLGISLILVYSLYYYLSHYTYKIYYVEVPNPSYPILNNSADYFNDKNISRRLI